MLAEECIKNSSSIGVNILNVMQISLSCFDIRMSEAFLNVLDVYTSVIQIIIV